MYSMKNKKIHLVNQKIVVDILKNKENFEKYLMSDKIFKSDYVKKIYAEKVCQYIGYLENHGFELSQEQKEIKEKCMEITSVNNFYIVQSNFGDFLDEQGIIENEDDLDKEKEQQKKLKVKKEKIKKFIFSIALNEKKFNEFFAGKIELPDFEMEDLKMYMYDYNNVFSYYLSADLYTGNNENIKRLLKIYSFLSKNPDLTNEKLNFEIDKQLEEKVLNMVPQELLNKQNRTADEEGKLAAEIYNALNKCVAYDEKIHLQDQGSIYESKKETEITRAFFKSPEKVSLKDNRVICKNWSQLYAKLLRNNGINAYVTRTEIHTRVIVVDKEKNMYIADSTDIQDKSIEEDNIFWSADIVRSKLGLRTTNFYRLNEDNLGRQTKEYYRDGKFVKPKIKVAKNMQNFKGPKLKLKSIFSYEEKKMFNEFVNKALNNAPIEENEYETVLKMLKIIEETGRIPSVFLDLKSSNNFKKNKFDEEIFENKVKLMNRFIMALKPIMNDDNLVNRNLSSNLYYFLFQNDSVGRFETLYKVDKNKNVKMMPVMYHIDSNEHSTKKIIYIFDEEEGFKRTTTQQLKTKLNNKELFFNYACHDRYKPCDNSIEAELVKSREVYTAYEDI